MLTLDTVRAAVLADQPWSRLDELVRAEIVAGQKVKQIYESLVVIADEIDAASGLPEDGSDALGDTLDALTGMCRADQCYQDPPSVTVPAADSHAGAAADNAVKPVG